MILAMRSLIVCALILPALPVAVSAQETGATMKATVDALCRLDNGARRDHLVLKLREAGLKPELQVFAPNSGAPGRNLVVTFGSAEPAIVLSAHTDRIRISPGANDNGSGCAVLLEIARDLASRQKAGKGPKRMVICAFLDLGASRSYGPMGLLAHLMDKRILACLDLNMVGIGDTALVGPKVWEEADVAQQAMASALERISAARQPSRGLVKMPPSDIAGFRKHGLDAVALAMAPADQVEAVVDYLGWRRVPGKRRPQRPGFLARARTPRDGAATIEGAALARAFRIVKAWIDEVDRRAVPGRLPNMDYAQRCRDLRRLMATGDPTALGGRTGAHIALMASVGPRGFFRTLVEGLEADQSGVVDAVAEKLLSSYLAGPELVRPVSVLLSDDAPLPLEEGLAELYKVLWPRLIWDPEIPAFRVMEKDVKGRVSGGR